MDESQSNLQWRSGKPLIDQRLEILKVEEERAQGNPRERERQGQTKRLGEWVWYMVCLMVVQVFAYIGGEVFLKEGPSEGHMAASQWPSNGRFTFTS